MNSAQKPFMTCSPDNQELLAGFGMLTHPLQLLSSQLMTVHLISIRQAPWRYLFILSLPPPHAHSTPSSLRVPMVCSPNECQGGLSELEGWLVCWLRQESPCVCSPTWYTRPCSLTVLGQIA